MAQIKTIDGERHNVKETTEEIEALIKEVYNSYLESHQTLEIGIIRLNMVVYGYVMEDEMMETRTVKYEPVWFTIGNIIMFY